MLFLKTVYVSKNVQSLINLAWIYWYEEYDNAKVLGLLEETEKMNSTSHFPYNLLG